MIIHVAETGQSFELEDCHASTKVEQVQDVLVSLTGVFKQDQLLFAGAARLDAQRTLGCYRLLEDERPIFLFNRQRLVPGSPAPTRQGLPENVEPVMPNQPSVSPSSSYVFDTVQDPAIRALPSFERQFRYHFQKGHAIWTASQNKLDACNKLLREMRVQEMALETVRNSMEHHYRSIDHGYNEFVADFQRQTQYHSEVLANFNKDIERLRACKLHPDLRADFRQTLLDCVKEGALRKSAEDCASYHKQLCGKVSTLPAEYMDLKQKVENFLEQSSGVNLLHLENSLKAHVRLAKEQGTILQSLRMDVSKVKRLIDDYTGRRYSSIHVQDMLLALQPMLDVQLNSHLPRMEDCDLELGKLLQSFVDGKNVMNSSVHQRMQSVASLQASIKLVRNQMSGYKEVMVRQEENFEVLNHARKVASSYKACLAEVVRRKSFMKLYFGQAGQLAEKIARKRENEMTRREEFLRLHTAYLPRELIVAMGLYEVPSQCQVDIAPFDANLLDIDVRHIENYVPHHLMASSLKSVGDDCDDTETEDFNADDFTGTSKLEVENARLKAQLASSIAIICSMDSSFRPGCLGEEDDRETCGSLNAVERTAEALRLKDEHANCLKKMLNEKQVQCTSYEARIRELEERLREQEQRNLEAGTRREFDTMISSEEVQPAEEQSETSALTSGLMDTVAGVTPEENTAQSIENAMIDDCPGESGDRDMKPAEKMLDKSGASEEEVVRLRSELEASVELLRQCQMNSAHLENRLHEAREEARIHLCAADRRAAEYSVLRASSVKLRGLMERLRSCIASPSGGTVGFTESLRSLSMSVASDAGDEVGGEFQSFISTLADKFASLAQHRAELMERCALAETSINGLREELESKAEMAKSLFTKCKLEKQASKEKICLARFEVHELALFVRNASGFYEAVNRNRPNYFLSEESIALFQQHGDEQGYILGQIVHIERYAAKESQSPLAGSPTSTPRGGRHNYGLPPGTDYFVVTVAMVPGLHGL